MGGKINKGKALVSPGTKTAVIHPSKDAADGSQEKFGSKSGWKSNNSDSRNNTNKNNNNDMAANKRQRNNNSAGGGGGGGDKKNYDWIASLARQSTLESSSTVVPSKDDRKRKREAKKARRLDQKQQQREAQQQQHQRHKIDSTPSERREITAVSKVKQQKKASDISKHRIKRIADMVQTLRRVYIAQYNNEVDDNDNNDDSNCLEKKKNRKRPRPYGPPPPPSGKKRKVGRWTEESIQPRSSDYSGIGLARDSLYIEFTDPSCIPKLEEEFQEHIPGFFGKQRTKAMKRQMDGNMLWRQLATTKMNMSKKMKSMSPDERVQALLDAGII